MASAFAALFSHNLGDRIILLLSQGSSSNKEDDKILHSLQNQVAKDLGATPLFRAPAAASVPKWEVVRLKCGYQELRKKASRIICHLWELLSQ